MFRPSVSVAVLLILSALILSACGSVSFSGEPDIIWTQEVSALPTQVPTATPDPNATPEPTSEPGETAGLDLTRADYDEGFDIYVSQCASCHGATDGVGPGLASMRDTAPTRVEGLAAEEYVYQSIVDPGAFVVPGYENLMPDHYGTSLTAQQINSLVKFIVEFDPGSMMGNAANDTAATPTGAAAAATPLPAGAAITISGQLVNGTEGGKPIPDGIPVDLILVDTMARLLGRYDTTAGADNTFVFEGVPRDPSAVYALFAEYDGVTQSHIFEIDGTDDTVSQDITVYDRTTDPATVTITWVEMMVNYAPIERFGIEVSVSMELVNAGNKVVTTDELIPSEEGEERYVSTLIELPPGAFHIQPMQQANSRRYVVDENRGIPVVMDTLPLFPGQVHNVSLLYFLPYESGAVIDQSFGYSVLDSWVLVPNDTVRFDSQQFETEGFWCCRIADGGVRITELSPGEAVNPASDFSLVKSFSLREPTQAGERLVFELIGRPTRTVNLLATSPTAVTRASDEGDNNTLPLLIGGFGVLLIGMAGVLWFMQRGQQPSGGAVRDAWQPPAARDKASLLKAITTLDDAYDAGLIEDDVYAERRAILSDLLVPLLDEEN